MLYNCLFLSFPSLSRRKIHTHIMERRGSGVSRENPRFYSKKGEVGPPPLSSIEDELLIMQRITAVRNQLYGGGK